MKIFSTYIFSLFLAAGFAQDTTYICVQEELDVTSLTALNTKSIEFSPVYYGKGLVFVVARERNRLFDPKTGQAYFDLMYSDIGPEGNVTRPENFSSNIRTQYHEGPSTFNKQGDEIFFTRSDVSASVDEKNKSKSDVQLKIYHGIKGAEDWEQITELPFSSDVYSVAHPSLSADGNLLVFSSNMPGGFGGMDLYVVERRDGQWLTPINLGERINSKGNDVFPFWHESGYLFFSSDGRGGNGGLDIYVTSWTGENFVGIQHLSSPYNSSRDDLGFIVSSDGRSGYFASDRKPTKGKDDLYKWTSPTTIFCEPALYKPVLTEREILVTNENGDVLPTAYVWMIPMSDEGPLMHKEFFNTELVPNVDEPGSFYLRWGVTDTLSVQTADAVSGEDGRVEVMIDKKATYAVVVQHNEYLPYVSVFTAENIPSYIRLQRAPEKPVNCFNTLFTVFNAAGSKRLEGANLHFTSRCLTVAADVTANIDGNAATCLPAACAIKAEITLEGYAPHSFTFSPSEEDEHWTVYLQSSDELTAPPSPIASGTIIVLDNIYYDFNKSAIRKSDAGELNALANILKQYPDLTIELTSHTDTRGSDEYNMELSEKRSESSKKYLMLLGIDDSRIITKAAGESMPRNRCIDGVDCSEAEHQFNRRTEVKITNPAQGMEIRYKAGSQ